MIRSRKMLKRMGDRRHLGLTPTVVPKHSLMCQRLFSYQSGYGTDSADVGDTFHTGFVVKKSVLRCSFRL